MNINLNMLGLRSEDNATEIKSAASYAMDCGKQWSDPVPENWSELLSGTIQMMQGFVGYKTRFLLIVSKSTGGSYDYPGCFPKCSAKPTEIKASTSLDNYADKLVEWVVKQL